MSEKKKIFEHIQRIKYVSGYKNIDESAKYRPILDGIDEDDSLPDDINKFEPEIKNDDNSTIEEPKSDIDNTDNDDLEGDQGVGQPNVDLNKNNLEPIQDSPDEIQNEIIKMNISTMQKLNQKIEDLESMVSGLNMQYDKMHKEVEEVREPTNVEKLMNKKEDSHPFYYNLNDMWEGNWFQGRRDELQEKGIKQMEDGTYVADFDDLPKLSSHEIKQSFDEY